MSLSHTGVEGGGRGWFSTVLVLHTTRSVHTYYNHAGIDMQDGNLIRSLFHNLASSVVTCTVRSKERKKKKRERARGSYFNLSRLSFFLFLFLIIAHISLLREFPLLDLTQPRFQYLLWKQLTTHSSTTRYLYRNCWHGMAGLHRVHSSCGCLRTPDRPPTVGIFRRGTARS